MIYAGVRPERIAKLVNLEGFGMPMTQSETSTRTLPEVAGGIAPVPTLRPYASAEEVAARLQKTNPRLRDDRAAFWLNIGRKRTHKGNGNY